MSCFAEMKTPPGGISLLYAVHEHVDRRPVGTRRLMMLTLHDITTNQSEECPRAGCPALWTLRLLTTRSRVAPFGLQSSKSYTFPLHPKTLAMFLFGTGDQRPGFSHTPNTSTKGLRSCLMCPRFSSYRSIMQQQHWNVCSVQLFTWGSTLLLVPGLKIRR